MKAVQGQQSFIKGQITPAAIARLGNDYFSSCRSVKDLIIQKDGSAVCRGGFEQVVDIPKDMIGDVEDISALKKDDALLFFYLAQGNVYFKFGNGVRALNFSVGEIQSHKIDGSETGQLELNYDSKIKQSFGDFHTGNAIKIKKILDRVFVFYENCFPFKIWIQGDFILTAPFFQGGENEIYNAFPFSRTHGEDINANKLVTTQDGSPLPEDTRLKLILDTVNYDDGTCNARLEVEEGGETVFLDKKIQTLEKFKGHPIIFSVGQRKESLSGKSLNGLTSNARTAYNNIRPFPVLPSNTNSTIEKFKTVKERTRDKQEISFSDPYIKYLVSSATDNYFLGYSDRPGSSGYLYRVRKSDNRVMARTYFSNITHIRNFRWRGSLEGNNLYVWRFRFGDVIVYNKDNLDRIRLSDLYYKTSFTNLFVDSANFYVVEGLEVSQYAQGSSVVKKTVKLDSAPDALVGGYFEKYVTNSGDSSKEDVFRTAKTFTDMLKFDVSQDPAPPPTAPTASELLDEFVSTVRRYFSALGYRFYIIFPYEAVGDPANKMKCKFISLGMDYNQVSNKIGGFGGDLNEYPGEDQTDNFVISDWFGGWPINGDSISGKDFFVTADSKLSYSSVRRRGLFGSPIKVLFNSSGFNYKINGAKQVDIFKEDFDYLSDALQIFFDRIDDEEDSVIFNLGDPFTYVFRDTDGNKVKIFNFVKSDIGAFTAAGAQSIALTDKGVFFWGINAQATNTNSFIALGKVSNFKGSDKFKAMVEVLNRVYVTDEFGDLYVVEFNETNRNFVAKPCSEDVALKFLSSGIAFPGNRILGVREDEEERRLYLANSEMKGMLTGLSEFTIFEHNIISVFKFEERVFVLVEKEESLKLLEYKKDKREDFNDSGEGFYGVLETVPITVGRSHPFHSFLNQVLDIDKIAVWTDGKTVFGFKLRADAKFITIETVNRAGQIIGPLNTEPLVFMNTMGKIPKGRGIFLRLNSKNKGCLCGLTIYGDIKQLP